MATRSTSPAGANPQPRRWLALLAVAALTAGAAMTGYATGAAGGPTICNTTLTGTVHDVSVPAGDSCVLDGATVRGGVSVTGGTLATTNSTIGGALSFNGAAGTSFICSTHIRGGVDVTNLANYAVVALGEVDTDSCPGDHINGSVRFHDNSQTFSALEIDSAIVNGSVRFHNNPTFLQEVESNTIHGALDCSGNGNIITDGLPNSVTGSESGQCVGF